MTPSDPSERALGLAEYVLAALALTLIVAALAYASRAVRRAVLPGWEGPPAWVADAIGALALAVLLGEVLGTFGAFSGVGCLAGAGVAALLARAAAPWLARRGGAHPPAVPPAPVAAGYGRWVAAAVVAVVVAGWLVPTISALTGGMGRADSLWYHMPLALRFAETGSTGDLFFLDPIFFAHFYPANTEVLHAFGLAAFERDFLSPLINLGFLALGLGAGWSIGRPYGVAPQALAGTAVVLGAETMVSFQAGESLNDVAGVVFLLCAVAILVNAQAARGGSLAPLAFAGLAAGLAAGTKLSFLAPVALLTAAVIAAGRERRAGSTLAFSLPMLAAGGYWYLRNLVQVGNPIPFTSFGPLGLPAPERAFELRPGFSVAHYWNDPSIWREWFAPQLAEELGLLWPLLLIGTAAAAGYALWRGREPLLRALGAVVLLTVVAYVFTPLTAGGEEGEPIAFEWNIRYLTPAIAIALALLPCLDPARRTERRRALALAALAALAAVTTLSIEQWGSAFANRTSAALGGALTFAALAAAIVLTSRGRWSVVRSPGRWSVASRPAAALAALAVGIVGAGYVVQERYLEGRYESRGADLRLADAIRWAQDLRGARVAISGVRGMYNQYPFAGADLSNEVQWLGREAEHGGYARIPTCSEWRAAINAGDYRYVVTMYDPYDPGALTDTKEGLWTRDDPHARQILRDGPVSVFEIVAPLDPAGCGNLSDLSPAELNGDSVNLEPLANQPGRSGVPAALGQSTRR